MNDPLLPWYVAGPLIGLAVPILLILNDKQLGVSSSFRVLASWVLPYGNYLKYDRSKDYWQVWFVAGIVLSSLVLFQLFELNMGADGELPPAYQSTNMAVFFIGAILIGFGSRMANGCTAGHCIMGNAQFAKSSIVTTIGFFAGGLFISHFLLPIIY